jgi:hypothetical protein
MPTVFNMRAVLAAPPRNVDARDRVQRGRQGAQRATQSFRPDRHVAAHTKQADAAASLFT